MASATQIETAFRLAGFRSVQVEPLDDEATAKAGLLFWPDSDLLMAELFETPARLPDTDLAEPPLVLLEQLQLRVGEKEATMLDGTATDVKGFSELLAAEILDVLIGAGVSSTGRPLDVTTATKDGVTCTYTSGLEAIAIMEARARGLRRRWRLQALEQ